MEIFRTENLSFTYPGNNHPTVNNLSFSVNKGELVTVCGATGSAKSTLLRLMKNELSPRGERKGKILFKGKDVRELDVKASAGGIGFVMQRPQQQIVTDKVWHELAFGLENLGVPADIIRRRVSEMSAYFGIDSWFDKDVNELSGGQKQLLNLAAVMVMQPEVLILDEPTAQLDPIAASDFINTVVKLNRELALTVIIAEHRLEDIIPQSHKALVLHEGECLFYGSPRNMAQGLKGATGAEAVLCGMPSAVRLFMGLNMEGECPLDVREGRIFIESHFSDKVKSLEKNEKERKASDNVALEMKGVYFRYSREERDVLSDLSFKVYEGEVFCLLGSNGSGKTTALSVAAGLNRAYSGSVSVFGKKISKYKGDELYTECLTMLPQDVQCVFLKETVGEELLDAGISHTELPFDISHILDRHPYDLSGGEAQLLGIAKALSRKPRILLLDEPTKGLDAISKGKISSLIRELSQKNITVVIVTHDIELVAECADRCALFFRGAVTAEGTPREFFSNNSFYTTSVNRMTRSYYQNIVTLNELFEICSINGKRV
ncbi:MAG: ATP-binding cassette domain-containing protein [Clostridiales bacterium]|nr:ATP-binding cassette domain-containing protein [Clostridiales bacterium]